MVAWSKLGHDRSLEEHPVLKVINQRDEGEMLVKEAPRKRIPSEEREKRHRETEREAEGGRDRKRERDTLRKANRKNDGLIFILNWAKSFKN